MIILKRVFLRGQTWLVREHASLGERTRLKIEDPDTGESVEVLCPPDEFQPVPEPAPALERRALTPYAIWRFLHDTMIQARPGGSYAAFSAGRILPEPYQFAPLARLLGTSRRSLLIADDVGLGKTIEAGICVLELIARGVGRRVLLVVPPGLISQWVDEMWEKFGLAFESIENSASADRVQTKVSEGVQPWAYFDRIVTSIEYLKRPDIHAAALARPWDIIVVDEAHYLAESGTPVSPYATARTRLGPHLRASTRSLILLTATPHNGYRHSFRSLLELIEPTDASLHGTTEAVQRRIGRCMIRRLKPQIVKSSPDGRKVPAFPVREPVQRIEVVDLSEDERAVFRRVSTYCSGTLKAAEGTEEADLVSFAMQIIKKRMLSSRRALQQTVRNRLRALSSQSDEQPPSRAELRELQGDLPLTEAMAERTAGRVLRAALSKGAKRRAVEKRQLRAIEKLLDRVADRPDPKIAALLQDLERDVLPLSAEKAIIFTEYRDTLGALRDAFDAHPVLHDAFVELTGGLTPKQRKARVARFHEPGCRILLATDAASEGLNLQRECRRLYHVELPWNPNRLEQRNGRIDRHGQTRPPIIRYLFHPDSPEDHVLDRLVQRITRMQDDRVSTPDILGILEGARIEGILGEVDSAESGEAAARSLMKLFDTQAQEFSRQLAPLLLAAQSPGCEAPLAGSVSADPLMVDDAPFEGMMLFALQGHLRDGQVKGTWRIDVPRQYQGPGVMLRYACATFRRSVAVQYPASDVELIHRMHPLFRAVSAHALEELTFTAGRDCGSLRLAVRRHPLAQSGPVALFTYLERDSHPAGTVFGVAVSRDGVLLDLTFADTILHDSDSSPGEVTWRECESAFGASFDELQQIAHGAAKEQVQSQVAALRNGRAVEAEAMREEAMLYHVDRLAEIDAEEAAARGGPRQQMDLFRESTVSWQARRAAVETHHRARLEAIGRHAEVPDPQEPQPLGVLLVFPV